MISDPDSFVDQLNVDTVGRYQIGLLALGAMVLFCDGFDAQMMSFVAPAITSEWQLTSADFGPVFAANLAGLMIGAALCAPFADAFSRKTFIQCCVLVFGLSTLAILLLHSAPELLLSRFVAGTSMGAAMPAMIALTSEFIPRRLRTRLVVLLSCSFSLGTTICGAISSLAIQTLGWRSMFWIGGIMPLGAFVVLLLALPESPRHLMAGSDTSALSRIAAKLSSRSALDISSLKFIPGGSAFPVSELFSDGRAPLTLLLWTTFFLYGSSLYFLINWLPTLVTQSGYTVAEGSAITAIYQFGGLVGGLSLGYLIDRVGPRMLVATTFAAFVVVALAGMATHSIAVIAGAAFTIGVLVIGNQHVVNTLAGASIYPNALRATGLGWSLGFVRLGGVLSGSLGAGLLLNMQLPISQTFLVIALGELGAGLALTILYCIPAGRPLRSTNWSGNEPARLVERESARGSIR